MQQQRELTRNSYANVERLRKSGLVFAVAALFWRYFFWASKKSNMLILVTTVLY
jgi:hypothetical protein